MVPRIGAAATDDAELLGKLLLAGGEVARQLGVADTGYRLVINHGADAGETVPQFTRPSVGRTRVGLASGLSL